jgi:hypothetical protein
MMISVNYSTINNGVGLATTVYNAIANSYSVTAFNIQDLVRVAVRPTDSTRPTCTSQAQLSWISTSSRPIAVLSCAVRIQKLIKKLTSLVCTAEFASTLRAHIKDLDVSTYIRSM